MMSTLRFFILFLPKWKILEMGPQSHAKCTTGSGTNWVREGFKGSLGKEIVHSWTDSGLRRWKWPLKGMVTAMMVSGVRLWAGPSFNQFSIDTIEKPHRLVILRKNTICATKTIVDRGRVIVGNGQNTKLWFEFLRLSFCCSAAFLSPDHAIR